MHPENSLVARLPTLPPTPPPDADGADENAEAEEESRQKELEKRRQWSDDVLLDFAAFESSIIRIQLLLTSNAQEREGYAQKKLKIEAASQAVRDNTVQLRSQLADAQSMLALRKEYDELAEKITSNRLLRPRDEQHANLEKLNLEISELQRESQEYAELWNRRRQQFDKIVDQTTEMQRQIKDEKEEVERREGMEEREDAEEDQGTTPSGVETPKLETSGGTSMQGIEKETLGDISNRLSTEKPSTARRKSPLHETQNANQGLDNPLVGEDQDEGEMAEDGEVSVDEDQDGAKTSNGEEREEGEQDEEQAPADRMDVT